MGKSLYFVVPLEPVSRAPEMHISFGDALGAVAGNDEGAILGDKLDAVLGWELGARLG